VPHHTLHCWKFALGSRIKIVKILLIPFAFQPFLDGILISCLFLDGILISCLFLDGILISCLCLDGILIFYLFSDGIREKDKDSLGSMLNQVAVTKDNAYMLAKHLYAEVRLDWPFYTDEDKQILKK